MLYWGRWDTRDMLIAGATFALVLALWVIGLIIWLVRRNQTELPLQRRLGVAPLGRPSSCGCGAMVMRP